MTEAQGWHSFAAGHIACPDCGQHVPVPVEAHIDEAQELTLRPVLIDVHAHAWTHGEQPTYPDPGTNT